MKIIGTYLKNQHNKEKKVSRMKRLFIIAAASVISISMAAVYVTAAYDPGTDPLVTVSYLNAEKVKIKNEVESSILSKLGFSSFAEMKNAIGSGGGSGGTVDTAAIVTQAKNSVLSEFGYDSYTELKKAILTVSNSERDRLNTYIQTSVLSQLGFNSMASLKAKINQNYALSDSDYTLIVSKVKSELLKELGYASFESLKKDISNDGNGVGTTPADAVAYFLKQLGYDSIDELQDDLKRNDETSAPDASEPIVTPQPIGGEYKTVTLRRGETLMVENNCEAVLASGIMGVTGNYSSGGIADITAGIIKEHNALLDVGHSYLIPKPENSYALICVSSEAVIFVRGEYEIN